MLQISQQRVQRWCCVHTLDPSSDYKSNKGGTYMNDHFTPVSSYADFFSTIALEKDPMYTLLQTMQKLGAEKNSYSLCFTRLPLASPPSRIPSIPCLPTAIECSLALATYSNNSVSTCGQLSLRYSKPSVCMTAVQINLLETLLTQSLNYNEFAF